MIEDIDYWPIWKETEKMVRALIKTYLNERYGTDWESQIVADCGKNPNWMTSFELLKGVKTLIIDSIRITPHPHPTHYCMPESLPAIIRINPEKVWYTHLGHDSSRKQIKEWVRQQKKEHTELRNICINPAWDGLIIPE